MESRIPENQEEHPLLEIIYEEYKNSRFKKDFTFKEYVNTVNNLDKYDLLKEISYYSSPWRRILSFFWVHMKR